MSTNEDWPTSQGVPGPLGPQPPMGPPQWQHASPAAPLPAVGQPPGWPPPPAVPGTWPQPGYGYWPVQVKPRNPGVALLASFFLTGLGQLVNGEVLKGVLMFSLQIINLILVFVFIGLLTGFAVWLWSMIDAYTAAKRWNAEHGIVS